MELEFHTESGHPCDGRRGLDAALPAVSVALHTGAMRPSLPLLLAALLAPAGLSAQATDPRYAAVAERAGLPR